MIYHTSSSQGMIQFSWYTCSHGSWRTDSFILKSSQQTEHCRLLPERNLNINHIKSILSCILTKSIYPQIQYLSNKEKTSKSFEYELYSPKNGLLFMNKIHTINFQMTVILDCISSLTDSVLWEMWKLKFKKNLMNRYTGFQFLSHGATITQGTFITSQESISDDTC